MRVLFVGCAECFIAPFHREFEGDLQQGYELGGKCGSIEIVLFRFDLASSKKLAVWTAAVLLFYTVLGFFLLPPIVRVIAVKQLSKHLDRPVTIQKVRLNPYTFSATIRGLLIKDKDGAPLVSWDEADVNFQLVSLFSHAWVFKEVSLSQPFVRVQVNKDYTLNFSDIVDRFSPAAASKSGETGKPRPWRINRLRLTGGKVSFTDLTPRMPFQRTVGPLEMTLTNFQNGLRPQECLCAFRYLRWRRAVLLEGLVLSGSASVRRGVFARRVCPDHLRAALPGFVSLRNQGRRDQSSFDLPL